ncbi:hypothetical protein D3C76_1008280 [compost metagenome]
MAQAKVQVPAFTQGHGVEQVEGLVVQRGFAVPRDSLFHGAVPVTGWVPQVVTVGGVARGAEAVIVGFQVQRFAGQLYADYPVVPHAQQRVVA